MLYCRYINIIYIIKMFLVMGNQFLLKIINIPKTLTEKLIQESIIFNVITFFITCLTFLFLLFY